MEDLDFVFTSNPSSIIKVIGVGGGGSNAVKNMYQEGIHDVTFVVCNTDYQALAGSPIPIKIQLGKKTTEGLGAGSDPNKAEQAAIESEQDINDLLSDGTKMVFITAGMGGGTGTGAAPVIAQKARELGILTVGIVTIPFAFESAQKIIQALDGVERMSQHVDALLVINNEKLRQIYPDLSILNAFKKADETLTTAAKSIAEIITKEGYINCDFADVKRVMENGGVSVMSAGFGKGENRISQALDNALNSPLLNNNNVFKAKRVLLYISSSNQEEFIVKMDEFNDIHAFMKKFDKNVRVIWGAAFDETLTEEVKVTLLATGFDINSIPFIIDKKEEEEEENRKRIEEAYGTDKVKEIFRQDGPEMIMLTLDQMGNDQLINILDSNPTYKRSSSIISDIKSLMKSNV